LTCGVYLEVPPKPPQADIFAHVFGRSASQPQNWGTKVARASEGGGGGEGGGVGYGVTIDGSYVGSTR